jgi:integrase
MPLRAVYRRAQRFDQVRSSPLDTAELPAVRDLKQRRYCSATEVAALLNACPAGDRALWATAFYTGLRRGELQALEVAHVDLDAAEIRVEWGWDRKEGRVKPKSRAGIRTVPIAKTLRPFLAEHLLQLSWRQGLIFGRKRDVPFVPERPGRDAKDAWEAAKLRPVSLHDCRHTFASLMIAAGMQNMKALSVVMGHASVSITWDRYGSLLPGQSADAADRLDAYLDREQERATL